MKPHRAPGTVESEAKAKKQIETFLLSVSSSTKKAKSSLRVTLNQIEVAMDRFVYEFRHVFRRDDKLAEKVRRARDLAETIVSLAADHASDFYGRVRFTLRVFVVVGKSVLSQNFVIWTPGHVPGEEVLKQCENTIGEVMKNRTSVTSAVKIGDHYLSAFDQTAGKGGNGILGAVSHPLWTEEQGERAVLTEEEAEAFAVIWGGRVVRIRGKVK